MLVSFHKGFLMEGEATFKYKKHFWSKPEFKRKKIYCTTGIDGICDESELVAEIERLTKLELGTDGWGYKFHGWQRALTYEESFEISKRDGWEKDYYIPTGEVRIEYVNTWKMSKILEKLTGEQFVKFCKDYGIVWKEFF